jgi:thymidine kinase
MRRTITSIMGRLEVVVGPMYSGKSEELLRRLRRAEIAGYRVAVIKPDMDHRYNATKVVSHAGSERDAIVVKGVYDVKLQGLGYDVVGIDEVQFYPPEIVETLNRMTKKQVVIATGLDQDYRGQPFGAVPTLMALADKVDKLTAICHSCGEEATKTQRLVDGKPASFSGPTIQVGGLDSYEARCRKCWEKG